jgi:hypothetical protein
LSELGCIWLPAPSVQAPELLISSPDKRSDNHLSCAELAILNAQGLMVNPQTAVLMAEVALDLLWLKGRRRTTAHFILQAFYYTHPA